MAWTWTKQRKTNDWVLSWTGSVLNMIKRHTAWLIVVDSSALLSRKRQWNTNHMAFDFKRS